MLITNDLFLSLLDCPYKASRRAAGEAGTPHDYERLAVDLRGAYRQSACRAVLSACLPSAVVRRRSFHER
jgi:hypothetical protein